MVQVWTLQTGSVRPALGDRKCRPGGPLLGVDTASHVAWANLHGDTLDGAEKTTPEAQEGGCIEGHDSR